VPQKQYPEDKKNAAHTVRSRCMESRRRLFSKRYQRV
jgi:hypothetical protein